MAKARGVVQIYGRGVALTPAAASVFSRAIVERKEEIEASIFSNAWGLPERDLTAERDLAHRDELRSLVEFL